jgi:putative protein-disulfide isomerase
MNKKPILSIIEFTDPVCTWCWGSEPILRNIKVHYKDQVEIGFIMGGLVPDIRDFYDEMNRIGGDPLESNKQITRHWEEASAIHGMPMRREGFALFSAEYPSSYPQNIAYKAAQFQGRDLADRYLRRLREATEAEARLTNHVEVLVELANDSGLDVSRFIADFQNGSAEQAFRADLERTKAYQVTGFPTFLIRYGTKEMVLRGFQHYQTFRGMIKMMSLGAIQEIHVGHEIEDVLDFVATYLRVTPKEIEEVFEFTKTQTTAMIAQMEQNRWVHVVPAGNGVFIDFSMESTCDGHCCEY